MENTASIGCGNESKQVGENMPMFEEHRGAAEIYSGNGPAHWPKKACPAGEQQAT